MNLSIYDFLYYYQFIDDSLQPSELRLYFEDEKSKSDFPTGGCLINPALFNKEEKVENVIISVNTEVIS